MPGTKGTITRSAGGQRRSVYLSDMFGLWLEGDTPHVSFLKGKQGLHTSVTRQDGLLYYALRMLYDAGIHQAQ
jgi:hypothetical protein